MTTETSLASIDVQKTTAGVVGLGLMGTSIAACLLAAGHKVRGVEIQTPRNESARQRIIEHLQTMRVAGLLSEDIKAVSARLRIDAGYEILADCEIVIESVAEDLAIKREVLQQIESVVTSHAIIGSNTSALPITQLQQVARHPERFVGLHWAEPANLTRFLEIICGENTSHYVAQKTLVLASLWDKEPVLVRQDIRGFVANRVGYAMLREAFSLIEKGVATPEEIDRALRNSIGIWMTLCGPFRLMDILNALPSVARVIPDLWAELDNSSQPPALLEERLCQGAYGIESGRGFYEYSPDEAKAWKTRWDEFSVEINALSRKYDASAHCDNNEHIATSKVSRRCARIVRLRATPVRVPARPDSLDSAGIEADDPTYIASYRSADSFAALFQQEKWILEFESADGTIGWGETYRIVEKETVGAALHALCGCDVLHLDWRSLPLEDSRAYDGVEAAVLDLAGRVLGVPVHQLLGGACRTRVECSGWTGRRTPADAARKARQAMERGHRVFKFKCSDTDPVRDWCEAIRAECGDGIRVLLDPNGRWRDVETTLRLMKGVPPEMMAGLEDPINRQDYAGYRALRECLGVPLFLHVALPYRHMGQKPEDLLTALREYSADGFNINGSMFDFVKLAGFAALDGKPVWHGSEVDLGILEAAAVHAAAVAPNCTLPSDIFGEVVRESNLLSGGLEFSDGHVLVPAGPGLGIEVDRAAIEKYRAGEAIELAL